MKYQKELEKLQHKREVLVEKKNVCVAKQFELEDNNKSQTAAYQKQVELDFELAEKIKENERLIRNKKAQIFRLAKEIKC